MSPEVEKCGKKKKKGGGGEEAKTCLAYAKVNS